ncbi:MAG: YgiT-type zinc finger protein [Candidatus Promineifilaceae bacterium]|jgi:YgiT-type zinc finger domain-containing protein
MFDEPCDECGFGRCKPVTLPYMRMFGTHMIVLPNAPASKCDVCGAVDYKPEFLLTMQVMLEKIAKDQRSAGMAKKPASERRPGWTPAGRGG